jgi:DNA primase
LWRAETDGKDFSTPERRAGLEHSLKEITDRITDAKIADYYRRGFEQQIFEAFKRRAPSSNTARDPARPAAGREGKFRGAFKPRAQPGTPEAVLSVTKGDSLVRTGQVGAREAKELELGAFLLEDPSIALKHTELLAELRFLDPSLDSLRHELLNLAASGSSLEKAGVQTHLVRKGMGHFLSHFEGWPPRSNSSSKVSSAAELEPPEAHFLRAVSNLREIVGSAGQASDDLLQKRKAFSGKDLPSRLRNHH